LDGVDENTRLSNPSLLIFKLWKGWGVPAAEDTDDVELFEGYWNHKVVHRPMLRRKGFGSGGSYYNGLFWAVRAAKKDGKEVRIDAGDVRRLRLDRGKRTMKMKSMGYVRVQER
jgi:hypothetical protein